MPAFAASVPVTLVVRADARTGKLVRAISAPHIAQAGPISPEARQRVSGLVDRIAREQGVEIPLVHSVIQAESNYDATAVSRKGALGIMQLIPSTARRFGVSNVFDTEENIQGGVKYLRFLLDYYRGDYVRTIAAYNAGEGAVDKYRGVPPYAETRNYVEQVARRLKTAREQAAALKPVELASAAADSETARPITASVASDGRVYYRTP